MKINLLPEQEQAANLNKREITKRLLYGVFPVLAFTAAIFFILTVSLNLEKSKFAVMNNKYQNYVNLKRDVQKLKEDVYSLNKESALINSSFFKKFFWSEKLLFLSEIMPAELWLKTIRVGKENEIRLQGFLLPSSVAEERRPISILSNFIRSLQENEEFFKDFSEISLVDVKSVSTKDKDIFEFNITLIIKN